MANSVSLTAPTDYTAEADRIARQRKMAEMLQAQSMQETSPGQMAGGWYVPTHWSSHLAKALQGHNARRLNEQSDSEQKDLAARHQQAQSGDVQRLVEALRGKSAQTIQPDPQEAAQSADYGTPQVGPVNLPAMGPTESLQAALPGMQTPMGQQLASTYLMEQLKPKELFAKVDPKDYTPESVAAFQQTKNPSVLVARTKYEATTAAGPDGRPVTSFYDPYKPPTAPISQPVKREQVALGGTVDFVDPYQQTESLAKTPSPDSVLSAETAKRGQNMTDARIRQQIEEGRLQVVEDGNGGYTVINKTTRVGTPAVDASGNQVMAQAKPPTEGQTKAGVFYSQMASASEELAKIPGYDPTKGLQQMETAVAGGRGNMIAPEVAQRAKQAQSQWAEAYLRFKTGAAATQGEVDGNVRTYFPQIGDAPGVVEQKARMRSQAERDMAMAANRKIPMTPTPQQQPTVPGSPLRVVNWADLGRGG